MDDGFFSPLFPKEAVTTTHVVSIVIALAIICSMIFVQSDYIIDQGKRLKQLEQAVAVYMKETRK
jgi:hypothetical protein